MTESLFDEFEAYTENRMSPLQQQAFDERLQQDSNLRLALDEYQQFRHSIEAIKLKQQLETIYTRLDKQGQLQDRPPARPQRVWVRLAMVTSVLLLVGYGTFLYLRPTLSERVFLMYYQAEPVSRGASLCGPEVAPGLQAYRAGRFSQALKVFSQLSVNQPCVLYYRGLTQLALANRVTAITDLQQALTQNRKQAAMNTTEHTLPDLIGQKVEWYLALAYLKANRTTDARKLLTDIASQQEHTFHYVAVKALADLEHD